MLLLLPLSFICVKASPAFASKNILKQVKIKSIYQNDFSEFDAKNWLLEGPGTYQTNDNNSALTVESLVWREMAEVWENNNREKLPERVLYYPMAKKVIEQKYPEQLSKILNKDGSVGGGHIVLWNKEVLLPESYLITYNFEPKTPIGLGILFFSAQGTGGQDIFSSALNKRTGIFSQYIRGDVNSYHISY